MISSLQKDRMEEKSLDTIGGLLLALIIFLAILLPLYSSFIILNSAFYLPELIEFVGRMSLFALVGIFLWSKKDYALHFAKIVFIVAGLKTCVDIFITQQYLDIVPYVVVLLYLFFSRRVKFVYETMEEKKEGYQIWPFLAIVYAFVAPIFGMVFSIYGIHHIFNRKKLNGLWLAALALIISIALITSFYAGPFVMFERQTPEEVEQTIQEKAHDEATTRLKEIQCMQKCDIEKADFYQFTSYDSTCYCLTESEILSQSQITGNFVSVRDLGIAITKRLS